MAMPRLSKPLKIALVLVIGLAVFQIFGIVLDHTRTHLFAGVSGPPHRSVVAPAEPTPWQRFDKGTTSRLAILLTDPQSSWLGLAHALKSFGVPFRITTSTEEALKHRVVLVYPVISGKVLARDELRALAAFPRRGGHLIGVRVLGGGLEEVFGFEETLPSRDRFKLHFDPTAAPALMEGFVEDEERTISLGDRARYPQTVGTLGYTTPRDPPLAVYDDGGAAIIQRSYGEGRTYAFGFDIGDFLFRGHSNRHFGAERSYVNAYEPGGDMLVRLIQEIYLRGDADAVLLGSVPDNRRLSVVFSYDLDYADSLDNAIVFAEFLRSVGISGTFYLQTKYINDFNDVIFFDDRMPAYLRRLTDLGMEIGSHTVAHSNSLSSFPLGTGEERYPDYRPVVFNFRWAYYATILGELRVSKFLLEEIGGTPPVVAFRPGYLSYPNALPQALAASGYRYSSSMTANKAMTHLPFRLTYDREADQEVEVFEIPVTVEDEKLPEMGSRVGAAIELARRIARYGGSFVILTHPNILEHKLDFHRDFVAAVKDWAWFGNVSQFGAWWAARDEVEVDPQCRDGDCLIRLYAPTPIVGLPLRLPRDCELRRDPRMGGNVRRAQAGIIVVDLDSEAEISCTRPDPSAGS